MGLSGQKNNGPGEASRVARLEVVTLADFGRDRHAATFA
jgi:hypothetical protein